MRLFVAIDLDDDSDYFRNLQGLIDERLIRGRFVDSFHLTLKFLGEVSDPDKIVKKLRDVKTEEIGAEIDHIGTFPSIDCVKVIWAGFREDDRICRLQERIDDALSDMFKREKNYVPHVTLARVRGIVNRGLFMKNFEGLKVESRHFSMKRFRLIESVLTREGPKYRDLAVFG